jgi:hypothetical protein
MEFSTISVKWRNTHSEHMLSALHPIATAIVEVEFGCYDKLAANDRAFIQLESIRLAAAR